ncbi:hypothetical protein DIU31_033215 [Mucilaginibacter rubeus]|uniref:Uncharacterized protein n=1 Tax=Mucilaginibacter rubeus TaxID=2027860 RepID=A0AAE6JLV6_9SPHI|nr:MULTISPECIES: hypothetical protein [Mucilaginibacter]QEM08129.1 hypothetical protein DIU31_033215 [Mucilaginibacter rubeus]QEM20581.1 hypothetical protein DIU38_032830 [Mucilaginibacter gossypii]QTE42695.1 hypothetical protein J3L19_27830 [Mucilaginibacter rubeus]QTE49296.1 hypothetical protein J3L21_27790 [Mucilaginibacter rubeus]QTE54392.1 hypothetical protein J3L23_19415 [Mucilaginibacter rubeus]
MKNRQLFKVVLIVLLAIGSQVLFGFSPAKSKNAYKLKSVHITRLNARLVQYDFYFSNGNNSVTLSGRGQTNSGNINTFLVEYFGTSPDNAVGAGTASGTYSIDANGNCTINVTYTAYGHAQEWYSGVANYSVV